MSRPGRQANGEMMATPSYPSSIATAADAGDSVASLSSSKEENSSDRAMIRSMPWGDSGTSPESARSRLIFPSTPAFQIISIRSMSSVRSSLALSRCHGDFSARALRRRRDWSQSR